MTRQPPRGRVDSGRTTPIPTEAGIGAQRGSEPPVRLTGADLLAVARALTGCNPTMHQAITWCHDTAARVEARRRRTA